MNVKFVYVLSSDFRDYYAEMALVSIYSLLLYNKDAQIVILTDKRTKDSLTGERARIKQYVTEFITPAVPEGLTRHQVSRYLKTAARLYINGDMVYLDNDTIILDNLDSLSEFPIEVGAVLDSHYENNMAQVFKYIEKTGRHPWKFDKYFNTGILYVRDSEATRNLYRDWHRIWDMDRIKYSIKVDQPPFSLANSMNNDMVKELPPIYNNQILCLNPHRFFLGPKIIHYCASTKAYDYFLFKRSDILERLRKNGITSEIEDQIKNPVREFLKAGILTSIGEREMYEKKLFKLSIELAPRLRRLNKLIGLYIRVRDKIKRMV